MARLRYVADWQGGPVLWRWIIVHENYLHGQALDIIVQIMTLLHQAEEGSIEIDYSLISAHFCWQKSLLHSDERRKFIHATRHTQ